MKRYAENPLNVRLHQYQENKLNEMIKNESYCQKKGIYSKSDAVRNALNNIIKDYEYTTLGTWINSAWVGGEIGLSRLIYWEFFNIKTKNFFWGN